MRISCLVASGIAAVLAMGGVCAQDAGWVADWERAQEGRPANLESVARIAPAEEPGTPLVIHGRVVDAEGEPAPGVVVFAYHTDRTGVYHEPGRAGWRLRGWARTDARGTFELRTVRPGSYPGSRIPAHVHLTIEGPDLPRRWTEELRFADDPFVSEASRKEADDAFGSVRAVTVRDGVQHVDFAIRVEDHGTF